MGDEQGLFLITAWQSRRPSCASGSSSYYRIARGYATAGEAGRAVSEDYALPRVARRFLDDFDAVIAESHG
ncbi:MAG: hypothetical protein WKF47_06330 [Geodermatophilaceae bacterium]